MIHKKEIARWSECEDGTQVWVRTKTDYRWYQRAGPTFNPTSKYIVDDKYATIRKGIEDGKEVQHKILWSCIGYEKDDEWQEWLGNSKGIDGIHEEAKEIYRFKPERVKKFQIAYKTKGMEKFEISAGYYLSEQDFISKYIDNSKHQVVANIILASVKEFEI